MFQSFLKNVHKSGILLLLLGLTTGLYLVVFRTIGFDFTFFPGDLGDGRLNLYFLEHAHKFFTGTIHSLWDAPFMYPEKNVLAYSDNFLGTAPIYSFFRIIGCDEFTAYLWWFVVIFALNYITAFYLIKYIFKNNYAAVLGAFVFAFSLAIYSQIAHAQTFPRFAIPLAVLMAIKYSKAFSPKYLFWTILMVVYQIYCGIYIGFMLAVPVGIFLILTFIKNKTFFKGKTIKSPWVIQSGIAVVANVLILLPLMIPYMGRNKAPSIGHFKQISDALPTLKSYFFSVKGTMVWDFLSTIATDYRAWWNHQVFAGGIATVSFFVLLIWVIRKLYKSRFRINEFSTLSLIFLSSLLTFVIYFRIFNISIYFFLYFFPGFSSMRALTRIINIELVFFAIATAFMFVQIAKRYKKFEILLFLIAFSLIIFDNYIKQENIYRTEIQFAKKRTELLENQLKAIPENSVVSYEPVRSDYNGSFIQIDGMLAAQKHNLKTTNGYTATCPGGFGAYWNKPNEKNRNKWLVKKGFDPDTLYIISETGSLKKLCKNEIITPEALQQKKDEKLNEMIEYIRSDKKWMNKIKAKALEKNIPVDSMLIMDAQWVLKRKEK